MVDHHRAATDPYYFKPLYTKYRKLIQLIGDWPEDQIDGNVFWEYTSRDDDFSHDDLRQLVAWNFLIPLRQVELSEFEPVVTVSDFNIRYSHCPDT